MFDSVAFWVLVFSASLVTRAVTRDRPRVLAIALVLLSVLAIKALLHVEGRELAILLVSLAWLALVAPRLRFLARLGTGVGAMLATSPVVALWIAGKIAVANAWAPARWLFFAGASYVIVKGYAMVKDVFDERIERPDPFAAFSFLSFFPTYLSGPMHLYEEFAGGLKAPRLIASDELLDLVLRFLWGLFKVKIVAPLLSPASLIAIGAAGGPVSLRRLVLGAFVYSFVLYADFSGYSDMAIVCGRVVGFDVPENFRAPYLSQNIREFWQRWHITFSRILTGYLFVPLTRALGRRVPDSPRAVMVVGYLVTFLFCGYWHGPTRNFLLWGAYHAVGLIVYDLYRAGAQKRLRARRGRKDPASLRRLKETLSTAATFTFVSIGWIPFVLGEPWRFMR